MTFKYNIKRRKSHFIIINLNMCTSVLTFSMDHCLMLYNAVALSSVLSNLKSYIITCYFLKKKWLDITCTSFRSQGI